MQNYNDSFQNFKLIQAADVVGLSLRNTRIFTMLLNGLGIATHFHEFILGLVTSQNWDQVKGMMEIPLKKIARKVSPDDGEIFKRTYNRMKKNKPEYFKWQDEQPFVFIQTESRSYNTGSYKTHTFYYLPYHYVITRLFCLPKEISESQLRRAVWEEVIRILGKTDPVKVRGRRPRKPEATARALRRIGNDLVQETGSLAAAAIYIEEADDIPEEGVTIKELAEVLIGNKGLNP